MKCSVFLIILIIICKSRAYQMPQDFYNVIELLNKFSKMEKELWMNVQNPKWCEVIKTSSKGADVCIALTLYEFDRDIKLFEKEISYAMESSHNKLLSFQWYVEMKKINSRYDEFGDFLKLQTTRRFPSSYEKWTDLAKSMLYESTKSLSLTFSKMSDIAANGKSFKDVLQVSSDHLCEEQQSHHQLVTNRLLLVYNTLVLMQIKDLSMIHFSQMILFLHRKGNFSQENNTKYEKMSISTMNSFKKKLKEISRVIWRCDPEKHIEGETYVQITKLLQGYIENEVDMNNEAGCHENCGYYGNTKNYGCFKELFCSRQPTCTGRIHSCRFINSHMTICLSPKTSSRRYEWVRYEDGTHFGKRKQCTSGSASVESWWRWLFWHCSYCLCICDQSGYDSDRYFSLREFKSNITSNKIIIGLRFKKLNRIIHIEICEAVMISRGMIDKSTAKWRLTNSIDLKHGRKDVDYHELNYNERGIDLDNAEGPQSDVLTGVRFRKIKGRLSFEIHTTPFHRTSGKLIQNQSKWISNGDSEVSKRRTRLNIDNSDISTNSPRVSEIDSYTNQYVNFGYTDFTADFAQTTIPFVDVQSVISKNPIPLSGAGIYHKGTPRYGGFIALRIFTFDYNS